MKPFVDYKCPECGKPFKNAKGIEPHRRQIHGFRLPKKPQKTKPTGDFYIMGTPSVQKVKARPQTSKRKPDKQVPSAPETKPSTDLPWDAICGRYITPCPECGGPRQAIEFTDGTTLTCGNWHCQLFKRGMDNALRVIAAPVVVTKAVIDDEPGEEA